MAVILDATTVDPDVTHDATLFNMVAYSAFGTDWSHYLMLEDIMEDLIPTMEATDVGD